MILAIIVLLFFMAVDHYFTWLIVGYGGEEKSPVVRILLKLRIGPWLWAGLKLALAAYVALCWTTFEAWACAGIFGLVCLWNYVQIRRAEC